MNIKEFHERLAHMRATERVSYNAEVGFWEIFGHAEISEIFADATTFSSDMSSLVPGPPEIDDLRLGNFVTIDPPRHTHLRGMVNKVFTPRMVNRLEPRITELATELLDAAAGTPKIDVVASLIYPLPAMVISELLGIPNEDRNQFRAWADSLGVLVGREQLPTQDELAALVPMLNEMNEYLMGQVHARRTEPGEDLLSNMITVGEKRSATGSCSGSSPSSCSPGTSPRQR